MASQYLYPSYRSLQSELPYQVKLVADGFQALKVVRDIQTQLLVLDYGLPRMSGLELYDQFHAMKGFETIPALFTSANTPTNGLKKRHLDFIKKPFE